MTRTLARGPRRRALVAGGLAGALAVTTAAACGSQSSEAARVGSDAGGEASADVDLGDASDGAFPILPYPPGPYGGGVGDVLPDFTVQGYALSRTERDSRKLPWRDVHVAEVRSTPGCECLVVVVTTAGTGCGPCVDEDQALSATMVQDPSICVMEAITVNYDGTIQFPDIDAGLVQGPQAPTRADLDAFTRANREAYPVGIVTSTSARALSTLLQPLVPQNYIVRTSDMRVLGMIGGSEGSGRAKIAAVCHAPQAPVETVASGLHPGEMLLDGETVYVADSQAGVLAIPASPGSTPVVLATPPAVAQALAFDGTNVYYATRGSGASFEVGSVPKGGGARVILDSGANGYGGIASDGTYVYFTRDDGVVARVPGGGGGVEILSSGEASPTKIVVDITNVFWLDAATDEVVKMPRGGGPRTSLVPPGSLQVAGLTLRVATIANNGGELLVDAGVAGVRGGLLYRVQKADGSSQLTDQIGPAATLMSVTPSGAIVSSASDPAFGPAVIDVTPSRGGQLLVMTPGQSNVRAVAGDDAYVYWTVAADDLAKNPSGAVRRIKR